MAKQEDNVVPMIVSYGDDESETLMGGAASKLAGSQVTGFDMKKDEDGGSFVVPITGKTVEAEMIIPNSGETVSADGIGVKVNDHTSLNCRVASEKTIRDNEHSCLIDGKSEEHGFIVGDLVWCKIKNHPWLPAQVYDSKDASDFALKYRQEGRLLVVFFGDGSCSWCLPSQLLPFVENFVKMSGVCNSKSFLNAVQKAVDEFRRIVESDVVCKCVPENQTGGLARPVAKNGGVKAGVLVPEVEVNRISVPKFKPYEILAEVCHFAKTVSVGNKLYLATLKCRLSAFYRSKGYQLPLYSEPVYIEGLDKEKQNLRPAFNGFNPSSSDDINNRRRKIKSLAKLMGGNAKVEPKSEGSLSVGKKTRKRKVESLESHGLKKVNVCEESVETSPISTKPDEIEVAVDENISVETKQILDNVSTPRERKKSKYLSPPYTSFISGIGNSSSSKSWCKQDEIEVAVDEDISVKTKQILDNVSTPRERKKSKYLSPPCTSYISGIGNSSSSKSWCKQDEIEVAIGEDISVERKQILDNVSTPRERKKSKYLSPPYTSFISGIGNSSSSKSISKCVNKTSKENLPDERLNTKMPFPLSDVEMPVSELLAKIQLAAIKPLYLSNKGSIDKVSSFVSAVRSSTHIYGSNYKTYRKSLTGQKQKKSLPFQPTLSTTARKTPTIGETSCDTDDFISDVIYVTRKLEIMTVALEKNHTTFSEEEKASLKEDIKQIMASVENVREKVETASEKVRVGDKISP